MKNSCHSIRKHSWIGLFVCMGALSCSSQQQYTREIESCVTDLNHLLQTQQGWIKVHAAEYLLWTGHGDAVKQVFVAEEKQYGNSTPYRIGVWRVLAQAASDSIERNYWIKKIAQAFLDEQGQDRVHAVESLAKLRVSPLSFYKVVTEKALTGAEGDLAAYTKWSMAYYSAESYKQTQQELLDSLLHRREYNLSDSQIHIIAFALKQMSQLDQSDSEAIVQSALHENDTSTVKLDLVTLAHSVSSLDMTSPLSIQLYEWLLQYYDGGDTKARIQILLALGANDRHTRTEQLLDYYRREKEIENEHYDPDLHTTAAYVLLKSINTNK